MIVYVTGDLFTTDANIIMHGVNCRGGFGSGVAKQMTEHYPEARVAYLNKWKNHRWYLGQVQFVPQPDGRIIANCATQLDYLPRGQCHANYDAIEYAIARVLHYAKERNYTIAMPKIGAGLAGGDWNKIQKIINDVTGDTEVRVYVQEV